MSSDIEGVWQLTGYRSDGGALGVPDLPGLAEDQPVAKTAGGDVDPAHREAVHELREDHSAGRDDIGPAAADPRQVPALGPGGGAEVLLDGGDLFTAEEMVLDAGRVVLGQSQIQSAEGRYGPADAHRPVDPAPVESLQLLGEDLPDVGADLLQLLRGRRVSLHEPLGQPDASKLQADELGAFLPLAADDLGAPAPDVHDHGSSMRRAETAHDRQENET